MRLKVDLYLFYETADWKNETEWEQTPMPTHRQILLQFVSRKSCRDGTNKLLDEIV